MELRGLIEQSINGRKTSNLFFAEHFKEKLKDSEAFKEAVCIFDDIVFMEECIGELKKNTRICYNEIMAVCIPWYLAERKERIKVFVVTRDNFRYEMTFSARETAEVYVEIIDSLIRTEQELTDEQMMVDYYYSCIMKISSGICKIGAIEKVESLLSSNSELIVPSDFQQFLYYRDVFEGYWYFTYNLDKGKEIKTLEYGRKALELIKKGRIGLTRIALKKGTEKLNAIQYEWMEELYNSALQKIRDAEVHGVYEAYINHVGFFIILRDCAKKTQIRVPDEKIRDFKVFSDVFYEKLKNGTLDYKYAQVFPNDYSISDAEIFRIGWVLGTFYYDDLQMKDDKKAIKWFEYALTSKNAENEARYSDIMYYYAMCMEAETAGIKYEEDKFIQYLKGSAGQGYYLAEYELALLYNKRKEKERAYEWEKRAKDHGIKNDKEYKKLKRRKAVENREQITASVVAFFSAASKITGSIGDIAEAVKKI